ncbi:hypothetical protein T492DRAFT_837683 [Pavlovales sp. CCMP2436]|nr:hypothetical protein T492DRAFT_837683 [Pavlovales sp. CCMP2436]
MLRDAESLFADVQLVLRDNGAPIFAHRAILSRDGALAARLSATDSYDKQGRLVVPWDEDAPTALARARRLYGCDADGCDASGSEAAVELRAHLLALAAEAARGGRSGCVAVLCTPGAQWGVDRGLLAFRSDWFRGAFAYAKRSGRGSEVTLSCDEATREVMPALFSFLYAGDVDDAGELLTAELVVPTALLADQLLLEPLRSRAIELILEAVDDANTPSLFLDAVGLRSAELQGKCIEHMVRHFPNISSMHFAELPEEVRDAIRKLAAAARANPLCAHARLRDPREFQAILRESLEEQVGRHEQACDLQREEVALRTVRIGSLSLALSLSL